MAASIKSSTPFQLYRRLALAGDGVAAQTITANLTITSAYEEFIKINPSTGNRVVTLPTVAAGAKKGEFHIIRNTGTQYALTINKPAASTLCTLLAGETCIVVHDGTAWSTVMQPVGSNSLAAGASFKSTEQTGNGSAQNIAHGLGATPTLVWTMISSYTAGAFTVVPGAHDATNCTFTVTNGVKYYVFALK